MDTANEFSLLSQPLNTPFLTLPPDSKFWIIPEGTPEYFQTGDASSIIGRVGTGPFVALNIQYYLDLVNPSLGPREGPYSWGNPPSPPTVPMFSAPSTEPFLHMNGMVPGFPADYRSHGAAASVPRKRTRTAEACASCHNSRKTCNERRPCDRCIHKGLQCEPRPSKRARTSKVSSQEFGRTNAIHTLEPLYGGINA